MNGHTSYIHCQQPVIVLDTVYQAWPHTDLMPEQQHVPLPLLILQDLGQVVAEGVKGGTELLNLEEQKY